MISRTREYLIQLRRTTRKDKMCNVFVKLLIECVDHNDRINLASIHHFLTNALRWTEGGLKKLDAPIKEKVRLKDIKPGEFIAIETYGLPLQKIMELELDDDTR